MEKDQNQSNIKSLAEEEDKNKNSRLSNDAEKENQIQTEEKSHEEKILELEDKVTRTFAEMENQRRRFEKE